MRHPVWVCSKNRPGAPLFALLAEHGLRCTIVVEPQDRDLYAERLPGMTRFTLAEDDRGLAYARQGALDAVRATRIGRYWMLDDDISRFYVARGGRNQPVPPGDALSLGEQAAHHYGAGVAALEYSQFSWSARPGQISRDSYCDCCVLIDSGTLADYRQELPLKVDRDFALQVIAAGEHTVRLRDTSFQVPKNGSNKGGLHDRYADGIEAIASRRMQELWPGICEAKVKPNGRPDVKIDPDVAFMLDQIYDDDTPLLIL